MFISGTRRDREQRSSISLSVMHVALILLLSVFPVIYAVFNLTNNVDLENTKRKMELYQKDNKEVIQKNKIKLVSLLLCPTIFIH